MKFQIPMLFSILLLYIIINSYEALNIEDVGNMKGKDFCGSSGSEKKRIKMCKKLAEEKGITEYNKEKLEKNAKNCQNLYVWLDHAYDSGSGESYSFAAIRCQYSTDNTAEIYALTRGLQKNNVTVLGYSATGFWEFLYYSTAFNEILNAWF